ncbi:PPE FAMILY domain protein [Mycobacterium ulcerans str. Harvey]|uniref:PPE FAMILY domain protein n=1 Tax=Mycobacterium ulcerans str. Harvey TaxID=1299332 RepID=A0ABN0R635_MYCUL|nr:PPE FAMILY domain protein [Mycobacterium ulcerans str. Harvey]
MVYALQPAVRARPPYRDMTWMRQHWGIENSLHWIRDVTFDETSQGTYRKRAQVLATLRNTRSICTASTAPTTSPKPADHRFDRQPPPRPLNPQFPAHKPANHNAGALGAQLRFEHPGRHPDLPRSRQPGLNGFTIPTITIDALSITDFKSGDHHPTIKGILPVIDINIGTRRFQLDPHRDSQRLGTHQHRLARHPVARGFGNSTSAPSSGFFNSGTGTASGFGNVGANNSGFWNTGFGDIGSSGLQNYGQQLSGWANLGNTVSGWYNSSTADLPTAANLSGLFNIGTELSGCCATRPARSSTRAWAIWAS